MAGTAAPAEWEREPYKTGLSTLSGMRRFGYDAGYHDEDSPELRTLGEVTIMPDDADELRRIASFLLDAADLLRDHGEAFGHEHFQHWMRQRGEDGVDIDLIVSRR